MAGEDFHRGIKLPAPRPNTNAGRGGSAQINLGRLGGRASGGPGVISALAMGGPDLAQGLSATHTVLAQQEEERQQMEALTEMDSFRDQERAMLAEIKSAKGQAAAGGLSKAEAFYQQYGEALVKKARGDFQKGLYERFLSAQANEGKRFAVKHQIAEHESYKRDFFQGQLLRGEQEVALDPGAWAQTADHLNNMDQQLNPDKPANLAKAENMQRRLSLFETSLNSLIASGRLDEAEAMLREQEEKNGENALNIPAAAQRWLPLAKEASQAYGVPLEIILAVMQAESNFSPDAVSETNVKGLMQVTSDTYKEMGFSGDRANPKNSVMAGTKYLSTLYGKYGSWDEVFFAYNGGPGTLAAWKKGHWGVYQNNPGKQAEIKNYVKSVNQNLEQISSGSFLAPAEAARLREKIEIEAIKQWETSQQQEADEIKNRLEQGRQNLEAKLAGGELVSAEELKAAYHNGEIDYKTFEFGLARADGQGGYVGHIRQRARQEAKAQLMGAIASGQVRDAKEMRSSIEAHEWGPLLDYKDLAELRSRLEAEDGLSRKAVEGWILTSGEQFGVYSNDKSMREIFIRAALKEMARHGLQASDPMLKKLLEGLAKSRTYLEQDDDTQPPPPLQGPLIRDDRLDIKAQAEKDILKAAELPETPSNKERAKTALAKGLNIREVMANDAPVWRGKGLVTLKYLDAAALSLKDEFMAAGHSYTLDPNLLAAIFMAGSAKEGTGRMPLPLEIETELGAERALDEGSRIMAAARYLREALNYTPRDLDPFLTAYASSVGKTGQERRGFVESIKRYYCDNYGKKPKYSYYLGAGPARSLAERKIILDGTPYEGF